MWKQWDCNKIVGTQIKVFYNAYHSGRFIQESHYKLEESQVDSQSLITMEAIIFVIETKEQIFQM